MLKTVATCISALLLLASPTYGAGKNVKAGVVADVTGGAAVYGVSQRNAYQLAMDDIKAGIINTGGNGLSFDVGDNATDPNQAANLFQRFTTDGSTIVLGPTLSAEAFKAQPIAVRANIPVLATSNTAPGITRQGPCVFRDALSEEQVVPATVAKTYASWKYKTAAIIYGDDNAFTKTDFNVFSDELKKRGVNIVDVETYHTKDVDFQAQLTKIKAAKPDVLVLGALFDEATKIIAQANTLGLRTHMVGGNGLNSTKMVDAAGQAAVGAVVGAAWFIDNNYSGNKAFVARYKKKFGSLPDQFAAQSYAAAQVIAQLVRGGASTPSEMCDGLRGLKLAQTVLGPIAFDANRDVRSAPVILKIVPGGFAYF
ncbi:MAG: ABC transporter substrate-binding protein [Candidatus Eremiobacteraeota bacterium]|nr:ABC transporter substrate-binding protein [Candidatus Eremiobacteraeota bacterium]MBV8425081.1 ABC transporter substrate-binding protein [Candidatus Eremiobacteraeota bacterium]